MLTTTLMTVGSCRHCERMVRADGTWRAATFPSMCALLIHPTVGPVLFDTGYAEHFVTATQPWPERFYRWVTPMHLPPSETLAAQLAGLNLAPGDVRVCVISHFHADHVAGLRDLPNARFICLRADFQSLRNGNLLSRVRKGLLTSLLPDDFEARVHFADDLPALALPADLAALGPAVDLLGDGKLAGIRMPGHTAGQLGLLLTDQAGCRVLLCADAAWHRTAWTDGALPAWPARLPMHDWRRYVDTLQRLQEVSLRAPDLAIVPSHCTTSIATYRQRGA